MLTTREKCRPAIHKYVDKIIDRLPKEGYEDEILMGFVYEISRHAKNPARIYPRESEGKQ